MESARSLRILAAGDLHGSVRGRDWLLEQARADMPDLLVFLGDFVTGGPVEFAVELLRELRDLPYPVFCVPGNWDPRELPALMDAEAFDDLRNLHKASAWLGGYTFAGLGGSITTPSGRTPLESPDEGFAAPLAAQLPADVWVLHNPLHGFVDSTPQNAELGSRSLRALYDEQAEPPLLVLSGHIHAARGIEKHGPTTFVNPGPLSDCVAARITLTGTTAEAQLVG